MRLNTSLSRQMTIAISLLVLGIILLVQTSSWVLYGWVLKYHPEYLNEDYSLMPSAIELEWLGAATLCSLAIAVLVAGRLTQRILAPMHTLATSLRSITSGDLTARAHTSTHSADEVRQLVQDFNTMAERLENADLDRAFWNAAIAHELRTPVTILRGRLQGYVDGVFTPDAEQIESLLTHVQGLGRLIDDLRIVGLASSRHLDLHIVKTHLAQEVDLVLQLTRPALEQAGFQLVLAISDEEVMCDPMRIRQSLLALLDNAKQHAVPGRLLIGSSCDSDHQILSVTDEGPGIPDKLASRLFEPFQRGERSPGKHGSGLGLAVVSAIARAHGGNASCIRTAEGGSEFRMQWPRHTKLAEMCEPM